MKKKAITLAIVTVGMVAFYFIRRHSPIEKTTSTHQVASRSKRENSEQYQISPQIEHSTHTQINDPTPRQRKDAASSNDLEQSKRTQFFEQVSPILQERLLNEGFTQHEVDQTSKELAHEFSKNEGIIKYSEAAFRAAKTLNLSEEKKDQLNIAVLKSIAQSVEITFDRWHQCTKYRVTYMPTCVQDIALELSQSIASLISGPSLLGDERVEVLELSKKSISDAVNNCGISREEADRALRIVLSDCPEK
jgi:hypothetical protein